MDKMLPINEREYIRNKVGDVLTVCIEDSSVLPMQRLVESLVVIGSDSLGVMREILTEITVERSRLREDQQKEIKRFECDLMDFGVTVPHPQHLKEFMTIQATTLLNTIKRQGIGEEDVQNQCLQLLVRSRESMFELYSRIDLLDRLEDYLLDWMWAVMYLSSHQNSSRLNLQ